VERDAIAFVGHEQHLRSERCADELSAHGAGAVVRVLAALLRGDLLEHLCDSRAVLGVEVGIDFVEEVEGGGIALLDGEDKGEGTQTWTLLAGKGG
jgi:hypothetical protein